MQGCPLLFALAANGLNWLVQSIIAKGPFEGIRNQATLSLQRFADDTNALVHDDGRQFFHHAMRFLSHTWNCLLKGLVHGWKDFKLLSPVGRVPLLNHFLIPAALYFFARWRPLKLTQKQLVSLGRRFLCERAMDAKAILKDKWNMCEKEGLRTIDLKKMAKMLVSKWVARSLPSLDDDWAMLPARNVFKECKPKRRGMPLTKIFCKIRAKGSCKDKSLWCGWKKFKSNLTLKMKTKMEVTMYCNDYSIWSLLPEDAWESAQEENEEGIKMWVDMQHSGNWRPLSPEELYYTWRLKPKEVGLIRLCGKQNLHGCLAAKKTFKKRHVCGLMDSLYVLFPTSPPSCQARPYSDYTAAPNSRYWMEALLTDKTIMHELKS